MVRIKKVVEKYGSIFWVFMIGSFVGFIWENLWTVIKGQYKHRQGLFYEPLIPIYGVGATCFFLIFKEIDKKKIPWFVKAILIFFVGFFMGGLCEFIFSYLQETIFGTVSWNYKSKHNLNGRTSPIHAAFWGFLGMLFYYLVMPILKKIKHCLQYKTVKVITIVVAVLLFVDISISFVACVRQTMRHKGNEADNFVEKFLDEKYPDEFIKTIYNNCWVRER